MPISCRPRHCLPPAAFAIVMSTGTLACATLSQAQLAPWLEIPAHILCWLNFALFAFLCPYAIGSWLAKKADLKKACCLPAQASFLSASGIALLVLANQCLFFELGVTAAFIFWLAGILVTFGLNIGILYKIFSEQHTLEHITPVFFIPVVGLVVIPAAGCAISTGLDAPWNGLAQLVCALALGAGLLLYSGLFATMLQRHMLVGPIPDLLTPTLWIHLAPLGWGAISVISLGHVLAPPATQDTLQFFGVLAWGAAAWWVLMAGILTLRAIWRHAMSFTLAWWSFIFPLGSFTLLTKLLNLNYGGSIAFCAWILMAVIWIMATIKTAAMAWKNRNSGSYHSSRP